MLVGWIYSSLLKWSTCVDKILSGTCLSTDILGVKAFKTVTKAEFSCCAFVSPPGKRLKYAVHTLNSIWISHLSVWREKMLSRLKGDQVSLENQCMLISVSRTCLF